MTKRLLIHVEGATEKSFVQALLAPHLFKQSQIVADARIFGNSANTLRGGVTAWSAVKKGIVTHLKEDTSAYATVMVDYYAMPASGGRAWPSRALANDSEHSQKAKTIQDALALDIAASDGEQLAARFIPYVAMHEFESLLFSDCVAFANAIGQEAWESELVAIRQDAGNDPEKINDSVLTAPSKRIEKIFTKHKRRYDKPFHGNLAALEIGLATMRRECAGFNQWLTCLEDIGKSQA
jgi:Domain of unknown function (DUF4276)